MQTLAHILLEKESGRLDRPALIVVPTTLVHNWREEAARFTPDLNVLVLSGPQRKIFDRIEQCDLILTTYSLLWRDQKVLTQHDYHLLILDEAQYVKNATTRAATALRDLNARHRLCLTGTPLENHLGEIWSLFDFLLPGFLGSQKEFNQRWRVPIERDGDTVRRDLLVRRIRPFMLRRRKDDVATELPPKTTLLRTVELKAHSAICMKQYVPRCRKKFVPPLTLKAWRAAILSFWTHCLNCAKFLRSSLGQFGKSGVGERISQARAAARTPA